MPQINEINNYSKVSDTIASSGQPSRDDFRAIADEGYSAVVNLAMPTSINAIADEGALVTSEGMSYHHIPVVWEGPRIADLGRFFSVMDGLGNDKVWVHCALNKRASTFVYLYRLLRLKLPESEAILPMKAVWEPDPVWSAFIEEAKGSGLSKQD